MSAAAPPIPLNRKARENFKRKREEELRGQEIVARCGSCPDFVIRGPALDVIAAQVEHRRKVHGIKSFKLRKPRPAAEAKSKPERKPPRKPRREPKPRKVFDRAPVRAAVLELLREHDGVFPAGKLHARVAEVAGCSVGMARTAANDLRAEGVVSFTHKAPFLWRLT